MNKLFASALYPVVTAWQDYLEGGEPEHLDLTVPFLVDLASTVDDQTTNAFLSSSMGKTFIEVLDEQIFRTFEEDADEDVVDDKLNKLFNLLEILLEEKLDELKSWVRIHLINHDKLANTEIISEPLSVEKIKNLMDNERYIQVVLPVHLGKLVDYDHEDLLDHLSETITNSPLLMDIRYEPIGTLDDTFVLIRVTADVSEVINSEEDED